MPERAVDLDTLITLVERDRPDVGPIERLSHAVITAEQLGDVADRLVGHFVEAARHAGASWAEIGQGLGVSKQAAQKRFVSRGAPGTAAGNLARFTMRARQAVVHAQQTARRAGQDEVTGTHLLLGLLADRESLASRAIEAAGVSLDDLRAAVESGLTQSSATAPAHVPFSAEAKQIYADTLAEALRLGHPYVGTEHILLAMLAAETSPAGRTLIERGVTKAQTEAWLLDVIDRENR